MATWLSVDDSVVLIYLAFFSFLLLLFALSGSRNSSTPWHLSRFGHLSIVVSVNKIAVPELTRRGAAV